MTYGGCRKGHSPEELNPKGVCKECRREYMREWHKRPENRWKAAAWTKRYKQQKSKESAAAILRWRKAHPEKVKAYASAWNKRNPQAVLLNAAVRRFRMRAAYVQEVTLEHLALLLEAQEGRCRYCHTPLGADKHLDHRIPLARGGTHQPSNVCFACPQCNHRKNAKIEAEFLELIT